jgi:hypothetical protein
MLGRSGLKVSPLCLGGNVFGWTIDEKRSIRRLNKAVRWRRWQGRTAGPSCLTQARNRYFNLQGQAFIFLPSIDS